MINEKYISNFIKSQFPDFYSEEGPLFIAFIEAYYEWLEENGNEINMTRSFLDQLDIDKAKDEFLVFFEKKYLFGLPQETLLNKRLLIKHIKDIYKSTGSKRGWKLLFRILFNEDIEIYHPGEDLLTPSQGDWFEPTYIEVTETENINDFLGKTIIGVTSGTSAVVESIISQPLNQVKRYIIYLSSIVPIGSDFIVGEKITYNGNIGNIDLFKSPSIIGSLRTIEISSGGQNFSEGNILQIVDIDPYTNEAKLSGQGGQLRVTDTWQGIGSIYYEVKKSGLGYSYTPLKIQYKGPNDFTGRNASFSLGPLTNIQYFSINTDLLIDAKDFMVNGVYSFFDQDPISTSNTIIADCLGFTYEPYGSISSLTSISTGNSYTEELQIHVKEVLPSKVICKVNYTTNTNIITGNTIFSSFLIPKQAIRIENNSVFEDHVINTVNSSVITLGGNIRIPSSANSDLRIYVNTFESNYEDQPFAKDFYGNYLGENAEISGIPSVGKGIISEVVSINSGIGYTNGEEVQLYLYSPITKPVVANAGINYSNGDIVVFFGGGTSYQAKGSVLTSNTGAISDVAMTNYGSNYKSIPDIIIKTRRGTGALLTTTLGEYNTYTIVTGKIVLGGIGKSKGRWLSTKSFLNSDKYIQDSYFYQNYSYQLKSAINFSKYKNMLEQIYHTAGYELFGEPTKVSLEKSKVALLHESSTVEITI